MSNNRGSFLMVALWGVALFAIITASLVWKANQQIMLIQRENQLFQNRLDAGSVYNYVSSIIQEDPSPHEDSKEDNWYGPIETEGLMASPITVYVEDEESKINLNQAHGTFLIEFFKRLEELETLRGDRKEYVKSILKARYKGRIESLEELLLLEDFEPRDLNTLKPYITVYPELPFINPNTTSFLVLMSLVDSLSGDFNAKSLIKTRIAEFCEEEAGCHFFASDLTPDGFIRRLKLPQTPLILQVTQELLQSLSLDSSTYKINITTANDSHVEAVFSYQTDQIRPQVLAWRESL